MERPEQTRINPRENQATLLESVDKRLEPYIDFFIESHRAVAYLLIAKSAGHISARALIDSFNVLYRNTELEVEEKRRMVRYLAPAIREGLVLPTYKPWRGGETVEALLLTEKGQKCLYFACLCLDVELQSSLSLPAVLGLPRSAEDSDQTPFARARILAYLAGKNVPVREVDIVRELQMETAVVYESLLSFANSGLVSFNSANSGNGRVAVQYFLNEGSQLPRIRGQLGSAVARCCRKLANAGEEITSHSIVKILPIEIKKIFTEVNLKAEVRYLLSMLAENKFLRRGPFRGGKVYSNIILTDGGRKFVQDLLESAVNWFHLQDDISETEKPLLVDEVLANLVDYSRGTYDLDHEQTQAYKRRVASDKRLQLLEVIKVNPLTARGISRQLGLSRIIVLGILKSFVRSGQVVELPTDGAKRFVSVEPKRRISKSA